MSVSAPTTDPSREHLATSEAARVLGITPMTLREWERRFGFPIGRRTEQHTRRFMASEVVALHQALEASHSLPRAMDEARSQISAGPAGLTPLMIRLAS